MLRRGPGKRSVVLRAAVGIAVLVAALLAFAGCGGDDEQEGPALEGTTWTLTSGADVSGEAEMPTLTLADGQGSGYGGCNNFNTSYELDGDSITFGPVASTMMACPEPQMGIETAYLLALESVDTWAIDNGELVLSSAGSEVLRYTAG